MDEAELRRAIAMAADEAAHWDAQAAGFRELTDAELVAARESLSALAERLEPLVTAAETLAATALASPESSVHADDGLVASAHLAVRRARHGEVWAGFVLHQRLPPTNLDELAERR